MTGAEQPKIEFGLYQNDSFEHVSVWIPSEGTPGGMRDVGQVSRCKRGKFYGGMWHVQSNKLASLIGEYSLDGTCSRERMEAEVRALLEAALKRPGRRYPAAAAPPADPAADPEDGKRKGSVEFGAFSGRPPKEWAAAAQRIAELNECWLVAGQHADRGWRGAFHCLNYGPTFGNATASRCLEALEGAGLWDRVYGRPTFAGASGGR